MDSGKSAFKTLIVKICHYVGMHNGRDSVMIGGRAIRRVVAILMVMLLFQGCQPVQEPIPDFVESVVREKFRPDGEIRIIRSVGKFQIGRETVFCRAPRQIDPDLAKIAPAFYGPGVDGVENAELGETLASRRCIDDGINLLNHWSLVSNRGGEPYKLVLVVWQGDPAKGGAMWVGGLERGDGELPGLSHDGRLQSADYRTEISIRRDTDDLSTAFHQSFRIEGR